MGDARKRRKAGGTPGTQSGSEDAQPCVTGSGGHLQGVEEARSGNNTAIERSTEVRRERRSREEFVDYVEERNRLGDLVQAGGRFYHKWLFVISGGALGVSMTFVRDFIGVDKAIETAPLVAAWCMFAGSVVLILANQLLGYYAADRMVSILDEEFGGEDSEFFTRAHDRQVKLHRHRVSACMDYLSLGLFVAGVISLGSSF